MLRFVHAAFFALAISLPLGFSQIFGWGRLGARENYRFDTPKAGSLKRFLRTLQQFATRTILLSEANATPSPSSPKRRNIPF